MLLNAMIGAGILAAPSRVYALAEGWSFWVLAASAVILIPLVLCFADLGSRFSNTGGPYVYAREGLPDWMAFAVGWLNWFSQAVSVATLANLFVTYLAGFIPELASGLPRAAVIIGIGVLLTTIVLRGIRQSARAINLFAILKIAFVLGFAVAGVAFVQSGNLAIESPPPSPVTFAQAILIYLFAYSGFERAGVVAGETRDPQRDNPIALITSVALVTLAYAGVLLVCIGVLDDPTATDRPLAEVGRQLFGGAGAVAVSGGAMAVIIGTILVITVAMPRMLLALAEHGQLPQALSAVHPRWRTPHRAIIVSSVLAFGWALASDLLGALTFATGARLISYILCCVALWRMSRRPDAPAAKFNVPARGGVALLTAAIFTGVLLLGATKELWPLAGVLVIGLVIMVLSGRRQPVQTAEPPAP